MNPKLCLAVLAFISTMARSETFLGPTTPTNRLLVATNSAILITTMAGDYTNSTEIVFQGYPIGQSSFAPLASGSVYALAGPSELICSNAALVTFFRITNSAIRTQTIANDPIGITIASNQTMRLFSVAAPVNASLSRLEGGFVGFTLEPNQPFEFTGPGILNLSSGVLPPNVKWISYFIAEDGFAIPNQRYVAGPSGSFAIGVEKSYDLSTWQPVLLDTATEPTRAFYRLRIQR